MAMQVILLCSSLTAVVVRQSQGVDWHSFVLTISLEPHEVVHVKPHQAMTVSEV
jgi:hypothetical protein